MLFLLDTTHPVLHFGLGCNRIHHSPIVSMKRPRNAYTVQYDPMPPEMGGFRKGAMFYHHEIEFMLTASVRAFTPGTILRHNGSTYIVRNIGGVSNSMVLDFVPKSGIPKLLMGKVNNG